MTLWCRLGGDDAGGDVLDIAQAIGCGEAACSVLARQEMALRLGIDKGRSHLTEGLGKEPYLVRSDGSWAWDDFAQGVLASSFGAEAGLS